MRPVNIVIGVDSREMEAFHVLVHSIMVRATGPVSITPLMQQPLRISGAYNRERGPTESTEFSLTRFLTPWLADFQGVSIFMDCDMLCLADVCDLAFEMAQKKFLGKPPAVMCCQHDYIPREFTKFLGQQQTAYPRKNWSSLMVFDNEQCRMLTPDYVNMASGLELHRFRWVNDEQIGSLPLEWNWLVGEYEPNPEAKILHYTNGGPWFEETRDCDHAEQWISEQHSMRGELCPS